MKQAKARMDRSSMEFATTLAKAQVEGMIKKAEEIKNDSRKGDRLKAHECKACFYTTRMAGQAITTRPCMSCGKEQTYSSTSTDKLCLPCAKGHRLCKHCGGDSEMRVYRKKWPKPDNSEV